MAYGDVLPAPMYGQVRGISRDNFGGGDQRISLTNGGEVYMAPALPPLTELARQGLYTARIASGSAFTNVAALPTTRAELALYNADPAKSYVITGVWYLAVSSMAAAGSIAIIAQVVPGVAALTDDTAQLITAGDGRPYGGFAKRAVAVTTMVANKWDLLQTSINGGSATAQIGLASFADCYGKYIVRPGSTFGVNVVAGTAAGTAVMGIQWAELNLNY
jgi:hypothetical protein